MTHHLVGITEIAEMLGVSRQRVGQLAESYPDFPKPEAELSAGRVWSRAAIETWMALHPERRAGRTEGRTVMFERFTDRARRAIVEAQENARDLNHNYLGCEHLVLGLLSIGEGMAWESLGALGVSLDAARGQVRRIIGEGGSTPEGHLPFTPRAAKALELAQTVSDELGHNYVGTEHVLLGVLREGRNVGCRMLTELGHTPDAVRSKVLETMGSAQAAQLSRGGGRDVAERAEGAGVAASPVVPHEVVERLERIDARLTSIEGRLGGAAS